MAAQIGSVDDLWPARLRHTPAPGSSSPATLLAGPSCPFPHVHRGAVGRGPGAADQHFSDRRWAGTHCGGSRSSWPSDPSRHELDRPVRRGRRQPRPAMATDCVGTPGSRRQRLLYSPAYASAIRTNVREHAPGPPDHWGSWGRGFKLGASPQWEIPAGHRPVGTFFSSIRGVRAGHSGEGAAYSVGVAKVADDDVVTQRLEFGDPVIVVTGRTRERAVLARAVAARRGCRSRPGAPGRAGDQWSHRGVPPSGV